MSLEKGSRITLGGFALAMMVAYILSSLKVFDMSPYIMPITGLVMFLLMIFEFGIIAYIKGKKYRSVDIKDFIVWFGMGTALLILFNSLIMLPEIGGYVIQNAPQVAEFLGQSSSFVAVIGGLFVIIGMIMPTIKH